MLHGIVYVDGSFNANTRTYGWGGTLRVVETGETHIIQGSRDYPDYMVEMRNVAGELNGVIEAVKLAVELGIYNLDIYYDYQGIESWITGKWRCNKEGTREYKTFVGSMIARYDIKINFIKVKAHSGNQFNDEVDRLAKEAAGVL